MTQGSSTFICSYLFLDGASWRLAPGRSISAARVSVRTANHPPHFGDGRNRPGSAKTRLLATNDTGHPTDRRNPVLLSQCRRQNLYLENPMSKREHQHKITSNACVIDAGVVARQTGDMLLHISGLCLRCLVRERRPKESLKCHFLPCHDPDMSQASLRCQSLSA